ncbi:hypothetical protein TSH58p_07140 [Azospirillum sp. TSH58]|uniref:3TM-type holin n=1 Tax=Azospirillum sp. TSH58 TaxID=664962 RepID=UPI000D5FF314|nr:3TM-type holin [Azospirillum sp. TSH58]AWJ83321.1 hypothetical protein TSH58p_07140 [Azospirillum sp. TSH58]
MLQLLPLLMPIITELVGRIPDPQAQAKAAAEMQAKVIDVLSASDSAQLQVNAAEAAHPSLFVAGWRPAVGWLCVLGLGVQTVVYPLAGWALTIYAPGTSLPQIDTETLLGLLVPMLGIGTLRTVEKLKGAAR